MPAKQKKKSLVRANDCSVGGDTSYDLQTLSKLVNQLQQSIVEKRQMILNKNDKSQNHDEDLEGQPSSKYQQEKIYVANSLEAKINLRLKVKEHRCKQVLNNLIMDTLED